MDNLGWWKKARAVFLLGSELTIVLAILVATAFGQHEQVFAFNGTNGFSPASDLVADVAGNLYGTAPGGGQFNCGTVFQFTPPANFGALWTEATLYNFAGSSDGCGPNGKLVLDVAGNLYGTTRLGGIGVGTAFELSPPIQPGASWSETVIYSFGSSSIDGQEPMAGLIIDAQGNLYGTTSTGGSGMFGFGTAFELSPPTQNASWSETVLYNFGSFQDDGSLPEAPLISDSSGNLYGTASFGGTESNNGTVFQLAPPQQPGGPWTETILHDFGSVPNDGTSPTAGLTITPSGALLGMTPGGGPPLHPFGVIFALAPPSSPGGDWGYVLAYIFTGSLDGGIPQGSLTLLFGKSPVLYGTTSLGGLFGEGIVFQLTPPGPGGTWVETPLYNFTGGNDGARPESGLLLHNYALYGTTLKGGVHGLGTAYRLSR